MTTKKNTLHFGKGIHTMIKIFLIDFVEFVDVFWQQMPDGLYSLLLHVLKLNQGY